MEMMNNTNNVTVNFDEADKIGGMLNFDSMDKPNRGKLVLSLNNVSKRALKNGAEKFSFKFITEEGQAVYIDIFTEQFRSWCEKIRLVIGSKAEGNALIAELQQPHTFIIQENDKGFPFIAFAEMVKSMVENGDLGTDTK